MSLTLNELKLHENLTIEPEYQGWIDDFYTQFGEHTASHIITTLFEQPQSIVHLQEHFSVYNSSHNPKSHAELYGYTIFEPIFQTLFKTLDSDTQAEFINRCLSPRKNYLQAHIILRTPDIVLRRDQVERALTQGDYYIHQCVVMNHTIALNHEQLDRGFFCNEKQMRQLRDLYVKRHDANLDKVHIERLLQDDDDDIVMAIASNPHIHFTEEQVSAGLAHDNFGVRLAFAQNPTIHFTKEQIETGLLSIDQNDFYDYYGHTDYRPHDIQLAFINNNNIHLGETHIDTLLDNSYHKRNNRLVEHLLKRSHLSLTEKQLDTILAIPYAEVHPKYVLQNPNVFLDDRQIIQFMMQQSISPEVLITFYFSREDVTVSDTVLNVMKIMKNDSANAFMVNHENQKQRNNVNQNNDSNNGQRPKI
jgi:Asp-tRNA(Asn)/Glu-tRNA(Gln) amidotransferase C subunit